ncbi:hypothetical protein Bca4012_004907 [Brassica carinata]
MDAGLSRSGFMDRGVRDRHGAVFSQGPCRRRGLSHFHDGSIAEETKLEELDPSRKATEEAITIVATWLNRWKRSELSGGTGESYRVDDDFSFVLIFFFLTIF